MPLPADDFPRRVPEYDLPVDLSTLVNSRHADILIPNAEVKALLEQNGFAVWDEGKRDDVVKFYENLRNRGIPIFITSDSVLHLFHIQMDQLLRIIEEQYLYFDLLQLSSAMYQSLNRLAVESHGTPRRALRTAATYFAVPLVLLERAELRGEILALSKEVEEWERDYLDHATSFIDVRQRNKRLREVYREADRALDLFASRDPDLRYPGTNNPARLRETITAYLDQFPGDGRSERSMPGWSRKPLSKELSRIERGAGIEQSPVFTYEEDYSRHVPRGHYARSRQLANYFRAMTWLERMTFLVNGSDDRNQALVTVEEAQVQTMAACAIAALMDEVMTADGRTCAEVWRRIDVVTSLFAGMSDDPGPREYRKALSSIFGTCFTLDGLEDDQQYSELKAELARVHPPDICGGTGLDDDWPETMGFRLFGRRRAIDSSLMGQLASPAVGQWQGGPFAFTTVETRRGPVRGFPRGLDLPAAHGSDRARRHLHDSRDDRYEGFDNVLARARTRIAEVPPERWQQSLSRSWIHALNSLIGDPGQGYPTFMRGVAWQDKQLNTVLGSWSQQRPERILQIEQRYRTRPGLPPRGRTVEGYVEPVPRLYDRLLVLTRVCIEQLGAQGIFGDLEDNRAIPVEHSLHTLAGTPARLGEISRRELAGRTLSKKDYICITNVARSLQNKLARGVKAGHETTIIADVYTDINSDEVLQESTGNLRTMAVIYPLPDGGLAIGAGPVFSHYEFRRPSTNRLTDKEWKAMVREGKTPPPPAWTESFSVSTPGFEMDASSAYLWLREPSTAQAEDIGLPVDSIDVEVDVPDRPPGGDIDSIDIEVDIPDRPPGGDGGHQADGDCGVSGRPLD